MDKESLRSMEIRPEPEKLGERGGGVSVNREGVCALEFVC